MIEPPGNAAASRSNASTPSPEPAGHRRHEVLDGGRPLEPQEPRHPHRARLAHPAEVVAQDVDDHHVLGLVLGLARSSRASARSSLPRPAPRSRALDRVGATRSRRRRPRGTAPGDADSSARGAPGGRRRAEVQVAGEQRRVAGPQPPEQRPRVAGERRLEPPGQVRLVDLAPADRRAHGLDAVDPCRARGPGHERRRCVGGDRRDPLVDAAVAPDADSASAAGTSPRATRRPGRAAVEPASGRRRRRPTRAASHASPRPPVPRDRPVVQREPQDRQVLVDARDRRQPLEPSAEVVAQVPDEPARERRHRGSPSSPAVHPRAAAPAPRRTGRRPPPARRGPRSGRRSGSSSGRSARVARSRAAPGPGRSRKASAASIGATPSSAGSRQHARRRGAADGVRRASGIEDTRR